MEIKRNRVTYGILIIVTIILGLLSRQGIDAIPGFINTYAGDTLWALMVFLGFGFLFSSMATRSIATISLLFCYAIELSQLYHAPWINAIRGTRIGGLVLGYGFVWSDLICYTIGVIIGVLIEKVFQSHFAKRAAT